MKTRILTLTAAVLCLFSCNKHETIYIEPEADPETEEEYRIELLGEIATKSTVSEVSLNLADLTMTSSKTITAQLKKKSGTSWTNVTTGVTYSWTATSADLEKFSGSGTATQTCTVSAKAEGSGTITVSASIGGTTVATQSVPVTVSDSRRIFWSNALVTLKTGAVKAATLNCNFSGTLTVSSNNGSFLVGADSESLESTASITFSSDTAKTVYYEYTGWDETTVIITASCEGVSGKLSVSCYPLTFTINYTPTLLYPDNAAWIPKTDMTFVIANDDRSTIAYQTTLSFQNSSELELPCSVLEELVDASEDVCFHIYAATWTNGMLYYPFGRTSKKASASSITLTKNGSTVATKTLTFYGSGWKCLADFGCSPSTFLTQDPLRFDMSVIFNNNQSSQ